MLSNQLFLPEVDPEVVPPQVQEEICGEAETDGVDGGEGEDGDVHLDDEGVAVLVPGDELTGVVGAELEVGAVVLVGFVVAINLGVATVTESKSS